MGGLMIRSKLAFILIFLLPLNLLAAKKEIWVYTSIYKEYAGPLKAAFESKNPDLEVQIFQAGSEKLQAKVETELRSQKLQADLLLTSDPFWSRDLDQRGLVLHRKGHEPIETNYYSLMVLICHKDLPAASRPGSFSDL